MTTISFPQHGRGQEIDIDYRWGTAACYQNLCHRPNEGTYGRRDWIDNEQLCFQGPRRFAYGSVKQRPRRQAKMPNLKRFVLPLLSVSDLHLCAVLQATSTGYCRGISDRHASAKHQRQQDLYVQRYRRAAASYGWVLPVRSAVDGGSCIHGEEFGPISTRYMTSRYMTSRNMTSIRGAMMSPAWVLTRNIETTVSRAPVAYICNSSIENSVILGDVSRRVAARGRHRHVLTLLKSQAGDNRDVLGAQQSLFGKQSHCGMIYVRRCVLLNTASALTNNGVPGIRRSASG